MRLLGENGQSVFHMYYANILVRYYKVSTRQRTQDPHRSKGHHIPTLSGIKGADNAVRAIVLLLTRGYANP